MSRATAAANGGASREQLRKTHVVTKSGKDYKLTRLKFDCGCGAHRSGS